MSKQDLLSRHSLVIFLKNLENIEKRYPRDQHKTRMLPVLEEFKKRVNDAVGTENNEFVLLIKLSEEYIYKLKEAHTKLSHCSNLVELIKKYKENKIPACTNSSLKQQYIQSVAGWEQEVVTYKTEINSLLNDLNTLHHKIYVYGVRFSKKATSGAIY